MKVDFVEGSQAEMHEALQEGRVELAFLFKHGTPPTIIGDTLTSPGPRALLPAAHRLARREAISLRELAGESYILFEAPPGPELSRQAFGAAGIEPRTWFRSKRFDHVRALIQRGLGCTVLTILVVGKEWGPGLTTVPLTDPMPREYLLLGRAATITPTRRALEFRALVLAHGIGESPAG